MPLPSSGPISLQQTSEIVKGTITTIDMNNSELRTLFGVSSGQISLLSGRGKPVAGSASYTSPGIYTFIVPTYQYLNVDVRGGGGGGGGGSDHWYGWYRYDGLAGTAGTLSSFLSVSSQGGGAGNGGGQGPPSGAAGAPGSTGVGSNGDTNYTGGGSSGGAQNNGGGPSAIPGGRGGDGGRAVKTYTGATAGRPTYGQSVTVNVGYAGFGGSGTSPYANYSGSPGTQGAVYISWS